MLDTIFNGIFDSSSSAINAADFFICLIASIAVGLLIALVYTFKNKYSQSFVVTLALLPAIVCVVIMMVNGNIGAGVAVAGAFSLVRFRSVPGTAKEICAIFFAMAAGLATGMGYIAYGFLFVIILGIASVIMTKARFGASRTGLCEKTLRITIPEDLNYTDIFEDIFAEYATQKKLVCVKTTNMGSLYRLTYNVTLADEKREKEFIDKLRCRNGNLEISFSQQETAMTEL
jgi:hypothetical protein